MRGNLILVIAGRFAFTQNIQVALPDDSSKGWLGLVWIPAAMISAAFLSGANVWAPVLGGALFQAFGSTAPFLAGGVLLAGLWIVARRVVK